MAVRQTAEKFHRDDTSISFVSTGVNGSTASLDRLPPSFMYTQLLKNILLSMEHPQQSQGDLVKYWRKEYADDPAQLAFIEEFNQTYCSTKAIQWYSRLVFVYGKLNRALRLLETDMIVNMGFFLHDLHQQIKQLHGQQLGNYNRLPFWLYRGQGLSTEDFAQLRKTEGGLMAFNSFLSTSRDIFICSRFAESNAMNPDTVGVLFHLYIDPTITSTPFADMADISHHQGEKEVLFSMQAVFRIEKITPLMGEKMIHKVDLTLTADDDEDLHELTECMQKEVTGSNDWIRLAKVLLMAGHSSTAEKIYVNLLKQRPNPTDEGHYYHHLALSNDRQCQYPKAIGYYKAAIMIREKILYDKMVWLAVSHRKLALQYTGMEQAAEAQHCKAIANEYENLIGLLELPAFIPFHNEDLDSDSDTSSNIAEEIASQKELLPNAINSLAISYDNIGVVYTNSKKYNEALFYNTKALEIRDGLLPDKDFSLAISYNNIGKVYLHTNKK